MSLFGKIYHEVTLQQLAEEEGGPGCIPSVAICNEALFKRYLGIAMFQGNKIMCLVAGKGAAKMLVNLSGDQKALKEESFYLMGHHGVMPIYVDTSLGTGDILVVCKKGIEKIRILHG